ncbi:hypothetical protein KXW65_004190 [Aspergillus fumigatus]|nr:hypothetical protein KXX47_007469 [Aspergillus fumigatus]KAH1311316.1 hypothetical protein KXX38_005912 [Aspergillus fumigatus]KAH1378882.1 hypothetical protein KXX49_007001 [Aspergillus fumigatus]KAH1451562.1 hypothetical protein KXX58_003995 [Aspergillus fumigatus]KAH1660424.1 hypothetical protein KXX65_004070 [Aspergillus fumigatus]
MKMSRAAMRRPSTPVTPLGSSTLEDAASSSSSSTSICSCSTSPVLEPTHPVDLFLEPDLCPLTALVERFLMTISIFSATPLHVEAMAITPIDHRVTRHWLLIDILCHRVFAMLPDQGAIRKLSTSYYEPVGPGQVLVVNAHPVTQGSLRWCEATITKGNMLVAIVTALHDGPPMDVVTESRLQGSDDLLSRFDRLTTMSPTSGHTGGISD